jgi:hypothetical protein
MVFNGGWDISILTEQANKVFINSFSGNSYTITNAEMVMCMLTPTPTYVAQLTSALNNNGSLKIPLQLVKNQSNTLTAAPTQSIRIQTGFLSSLNSITNIIRQVANIGVSTADTFQTNTASLQEYYTMVSSQRYPKNKSIKCGADPENLVQLLASFNTQLSSLSPFNSSNAFTYQSFESNGGFASGIATADGYISAELIFPTATKPSQGDQIDTFLEYSSVLVIDASSVVLVIDV